LGFRHIRVEAEVAEDLANGGWVLDRRDQAHPLTASGTIKDFQGKGTSFILHLPLQMWRSLIHSGGLGGRVARPLCLNPLRLLFDGIIEPLSPVIAAGRAETAMEAPVTHAAGADAVVPRPLPGLRRCTSRRRREGDLVIMALPARLAHRASPAGSGHGPDLAFGPGSSASPRSASQFRRPA